MISKFEQKFKQLTNLRWNYGDDARKVEGALPASLPTSLPGDKRPLISDEASAATGGQSQEKSQDLVFEAHCRTPTGQIAKQETSTQSNEQTIQQTNKFWCNRRDRSSPTFEPPWRTSQFANHPIPPPPPPPPPSPPPP